MKLYEYVLKENVISEYVYTANETPQRYVLTDADAVTATYMRQIPKDFIGKVLENDRRRGVFAICYLPHSDIVFVKKLFIEWLKDSYVDSLQAEMKAVQSRLKKGQSMLRRLEKSVQADDEDLGVK